MTFRILTSEFAGVILPGRMITPPGKAWEPNQVVCKVVQEEINVPETIRRLSEQLLAIKKPQVNGKTFHYRQANVTSDGIELEEGCSRYQFNLLHTAFEERIRQEHPEIAETLLQYVREEDLFDYGKLGGPLSSGVGIATVVVLADHLTIMVHRSKEVSVNADIDHPALGEGVNPDEGESGEIDIAAVAIRAAVEELNLPISGKDLIYLGLAVDGRYWWPGNLTKVEVPLTWEEIKERSEGATDRWERSDIRFIPYTPDGIAEELRYAMEPGRGVTGFGSMALLQSGIYDFGRAAMDAAFRSLD